MIISKLKKFQIKMVIVAIIFASSCASIAYCAQEDEFKRLFDAYCYLTEKGEVDKLAALRTTEIEKSIREQTLKKDGRAFFIANARLQVPETYEVLHVHNYRDRVSATMYILAKYPPLPKFERPAMTIEVALGFKMENDAWKLGEIRPMSDPSKVKRPKDQIFDLKNANTEITSNIFGRVVRTEFKADHVLVTLRVLDEEIAVFLPEKSMLEKAGVKFDDFTPWKMQQFKGHPHKTDELKFFAIGNNIIED